MVNNSNETELLSESDVEQKFVLPLITSPEPEGLGFDGSDFRTKVDIRKIIIDKGSKRKLYFPDYAVVMDGVPALIIEAKAPGADLSEAIREGRLYATEINSSYPRGTNPCQRILVTDGLEVVGCFWDQDEPHVRITRENLNSISPEFQELQKFASKKSLRVEVDRLLRSIRTTSTYFKPVHMLGGLAVANESVGDNSFGSNVSIEYKYLFNPESPTDRASVVHNAYVVSKRKLSHVAPIDKIIRAATPPHVLDTRPIADTGSPIEIVEKLGVVENVRNELCLLIGSVGSGKSTFTDYLRLEALPASVAAITVWVNINLNTAPLSRDKIYDWIVSEVIDSIRRVHPDIDFDGLATLRKIYGKEISKVERGKAALYPKDSEKYADAIYAEIDRLQRDRVGTLKNLIEFLYQGAGRLLVVVLDNCDKRKRDDQLLMFEVASWLKSEFYCMIFLPLRDTTYDKYRDEPPLDTVIKDLVFRIDPPLLERVIYSRIEYALREISGSERNFYYYLPNGIRVSCARVEVGYYLKTVIASLFQDQFFRRMITGLAGRNIRKGLEILLDFCKSGHIGEGEILKIRQSNGEYTLPNHVVAKILLKGRRRFYSDENSNVKNLFSSDGDDSLPNPFVRIAILQWLKSRRREYGPNNTMGFHQVKDMILELQGLGFASERALAELKVLLSAECIATENQSQEVTLNDLVSLAPAGFVHLDLIKNIDYLSAISEDVLFRENQPAKAIADNLVGKGRFAADTRQSAIGNSKILVDYLSSYHKRFFIGVAGVVPEDEKVDLVTIEDLAKYVDRIAGNDREFRDIVLIESQYPKGSEIDGQIVSVQAYGLFVEFGIKGYGLIHSSQFNDLNNKPNVLETGDWVIVEILGYNADRRRFNLKLIDR